MSLLINFKDAVNASVLDPNATHAVYYCDGLFENEAQVRARCPHAILHAITVRGATGHHIFGCDSEQGDLTVPETERWVAEQVRLDVSPVVPYANQNRWLNEGLLAALAKYHARIERWDADYDGSTVLAPWASAKQYATGNVDLDVARANFFGDQAHPAKAKPHGVARIELTYNLETGKWAQHDLPGIVHWGTDELWASLEVQVCRGGARKGQWRRHELPYDSPPLGR